MSDAVPRVSIGVVVRNGERFLPAALESLLAQTFTDLEVVVGDNASTDGTEAIVRHFARRDHRVRYYRNERNLGAAANYNRVLSRCRGEYFKWAAHDDVCHPEFVARCVEELDRNPSVVLAYPRAAMIDAEGKHLGLAHVGLDIQGPPHERLRRYVNWLPGATAIHPLIFGLMRSEVLAETGQIGKYISSNQVLLGELALHGEFSELPRCLFFYRRHAGASVDANRDFASRMRWFDPDHTGKLLFPHWRLLRGYVAAIGRAPLGPEERLRCYDELRPWWRWRRPMLGKELLVNAAAAAGLTSVSLPGIRKRLPSHWGTGI